MAAIGIASLAVGSVGLGAQLIDGALQVKDLYGRELTYDLGVYDLSILSDKFQKLCRQLATFHYMLHNTKEYRHVNTASVLIRAAFTRTVLVVLLLIKQVYLSKNKKTGKVRPIEPKSKIALFRKIKETTSAFSKRLNTNATKDQLRAREGFEKNAAAFADGQGFKNQGTPGGRDYVRELNGYVQGLGGMAHHLVKHLISDEQLEEDSVLSTTLPQYDFTMVKVFLEDLKAYARDYEQAWNSTDVEETAYEFERTFERSEWKETTDELIKKWGVDVQRVRLVTRSFSGGNGQPTGADGEGIAGEYPGIGKEKREISLLEQIVSVHRT